jgi:hypothetical protein
LGVDSNSWPVRVATYQPALLNHDFLFLFFLFFFLWRIQLACCEKYFGKKNIFFIICKILWLKFFFGQGNKKILSFFKSPKFVTIVVTNNMRKGGEGFL